jgi:hypothetical protein
MGSGMGLALSGLETAESWFVFFIWLRFLLAGEDGWMVAAVLDYFSDKIDTGVRVRERSGTRIRETDDNLDTLC